MRDREQVTTRRQALSNLAAFLAASPLLRSQQDPLRPHGRAPRLEELLTSFDFEPVAYAKVPRDAYDYTAQGADDEFTARRNREAFDWVRLVTRAVVDTSSVQTATEVLGTKMAFPILVSPTASQGQLHPDGEMAMHQGTTGASNTIMVVSNVATFPLEKIAAVAAGPLWFQLYPREELAENDELLERAHATGCRAIVMTVDQQSTSSDRQLRNRNLRTAAVPARRAAGRTPPPPRNPYRIADSRLWLDWKFVDYLRPRLKSPLVAKGILTAEDARLCVEHGLDAVWVSNHGGRSLDYGPSSLEVLPEIVDAVQGRIPVLIDSGFRRGADVLKALALGAKAVSLGRVPRWGLAAYGAPGVQRVLEIVQAELVAAMAHAGRATLASLDPSAVLADFP
jgi:isopentenyl diphosphate isomerase/L-lactate dehydrogenase-like FMN-dependent dehydrogenase